MVNLIIPYVLLSCNLLTTTVSNREKIEILPTFTYLHFIKTINYHQTKKAQQETLQHHVEATYQSEHRQLISQLNELATEIDHYNQLIDIYQLKKECFVILQLQYQNLEIPPSTYLSSQIKIKKASIQLKKQYTQLIKMKQQIEETAKILPQPALFSDHEKKRKNTKQTLPTQINNPKHQVWVLLLLDTKLRAKEIITLCHQNINLGQKTIQLTNRTIPLTARCYQALSSYLKNKQYPPEQKFLFPNKSNEQPIRVTAIYKILERLRKKEATYFQPSKILFARTNNPSTNTLPTSSTLQDTKPEPNIFDREEELTQINELINKNQNILLLGPIGVGKSHLIQQIQPQNRKILHLDDCYDIKRSLIQILLYLYENDKEKLRDTLHKNYELGKLATHLQRDSIHNLSRHIIKLTKSQEYMLVIDNLDHLTPKAIKTLESLKDHFTILTSAREIPITKSSFTWNFEIVPIRNLSRKKSLAFIHHLSKNMQIEDVIHFQNHLYHQSDGNPRAIKEIIKRYEKETYLTKQTINKIHHPGNRKEYDLSILFILLLTVIASLRYVANQMNNQGLKLVGSIALLLVITLRYFFRPTKRNKHLK